MFISTELIYWAQQGVEIIANEQAERRREACEAASLMPREVVRQAEKFSIVLWKL